MKFVCRKSSGQVVLYGEDVGEVDKEKFEVMEYTPSKQEMEHIKQNYLLRFEGKELKCTKNDLGHRKEKKQRLQKARRKLESKKLITPHETKALFIEILDCLL